MGSGQALIRREKYNPSVHANLQEGIYPQHSRMPFGPGRWFLQRQVAVAIAQVHAGWFQLAGSVK